MEDEGSTTFIEDEYFKHKLMNNGLNYIIALQDMNEDNDCPGLDKTVIPMKLNDPTLKPGDIVAPASFKMFPLRCVSQRAERAGIGWIYNFEYNTANNNEFYPKDLLTANEKWEKLFNAVGEATGQRGSFKSSLTKGWIEYAGNMTTLSKSVKVTDKATAQFLHFDFQTAGINPMVKQELNGYDQIINYLEAEFLTQCPMEEENYYLWGTANSAPLTKSSAIDESSGYHVNIGSGFFQHATYGPMRQYSPKAFDIEEIGTELISLVNQRVSYDDYNWVGLFGGRAAQLFMNDAKKKYGMAAYATHFSDMTGSAEAVDKVNRQGVQFPTKQFTKFNMDPYGSIRVSHWRDLDSPQFMGGDLKYDGSPISSWWIFFLNLGLKGSSKKNIEKIVKKNSEMYAYVCGTWTPRGPISNMSQDERNKYRASHTGAYYSLEWQKTVGFNMRDTSNMLWYIPNIGL